MKKICTKENCKGKNCSERHPKVCRYFNSNEACKFGATCSYLHVINKEKGDICQLTSKVHELESMIKSMSQQIEDLTIELEVVKTKKEINSNDISTEQKRCDLCEYTASSSTVLKRHVTMKHKKDVQSADIPTKFKCEICQHESISTSALKYHISLKHYSTIQLKWRLNTCHICTTVFNDTTLFKNHMIEQHGFLDDSNECMHCESTQLGNYTPVPSQKIFMECTNCRVWLDIENGLI